MENLYYEKYETCPVCQNTFSATKVRLSKLVVKNHEKDFFTHYEGDIYPFFYDVLQCPYCGYAALKEIFQDLTEAQKHKLKNKLANLWTKHTVAARRTPQDALVTYKFAIYLSQFKGDKPIIIANLCHRTAWIYRILGQQEQEKRFLTYAKEYYEKSYETDETVGIKIVYIIGELNRRLNKKEDAYKWFSKVLQAPKDNRMILEFARESIQEMRENKDKA